MDTVIRALAVYVVLMVVFRVAGKRALADVTTFDFILLLIISETIQQALIANDNSFTNAFLLVITLVGLDIALSLLKRRSHKLEKLLDDVPVLVAKSGRPLRREMEKERIDEEDIMQQARERQGLERMEQIKYAVLERSGGITIIPKGDAR